MRIKNILLIGSLLLLPRLASAIEVEMRAGADCTLISILGGSHGTGGWEKLPQGQEYKEQTVMWLKKKLRLRT